jgi:CrcB protein
VRAVVGIAIGGAVGALGRYYVDGFVSRRGGAFPWGTFVVNLTGAFVLGLLFTVMTEHFRTAPWVRASVLVGFIGAYTTFSTLSLESYRLLEDGAYGLAVANALGSIVAGVLAVYAGIVVGRAV